MPLSPLVIASLAATWIVWGSTYLAIRFALVSLPPFLQMASRFLFAGALLLAWMVLLRRAALPTARQWRHALLVGALMLGGGMGGTAYAEQTIGSGLVVAFVAIVPVIIVGLNGLWGIRPSPRELVGIAVGLGGVLMLTRGHGFQASPAGLVAICIACAAWSLGSVLSQQRYPLGVLLGGEVVSGFEWIAAAVVLTGVVVLLSARR